MIRRLARDESGMTMGLTVIMIVLIGVLGAGLLTFVQNDLSSVIESNQGQTAFNLADAGTQAAKRHLLVDANVFNYDGNSSTGSAPGGESPWSCVPDANNVCTAGSGKVIPLDAGAGTETRVWIKYLRPSDSTSELGHPDHAPEMVPTGQSDYEFGRDFFKVISEGRAGNARRKVEAIYQTYDLGTPRAYFAQGSIWIRGTAEIKNISIFSLRNITLEGSTADKVTGQDYAYRNWHNPPFNTTARGTEDAGVGAAGDISLDSRMQPGQDFDNATSPRFIKKVPPDAPQLTSEISFPFNYERQPDIEMMRKAAQMQGNYYQISASAVNLQGAWETGVPASDPDWPANSDISTVVFVRFTNTATITSNRLSWEVDHPTFTDECNAVANLLTTPAKGTLVVENGNYRTLPQKLPLRGTVVIRNGTPTGTTYPADRTQPPYYSYTDTGNACMQTFTHTEGDMDIGGNPGAFTQERGNRPGFFGVRLWSWRECYTATCT
jgi:hypothetical protein